jgi:tripartite-type tricarboxylate transporter receptor subunit TctC
VAKHAAGVKVLQQKDLREKLASTGVDPQSSTPDEFGELLRREVEKFTRLAQRAKLALD